VPESDKVRRRGLYWFIHYLFVALVKMYFLQHKILILLSILSYVSIVVVHGQYRCGERWLLVLEWANG
jgi:hypothetical protein